MVCVGIAVQGQQKVNMYRLHIDIPLNLDEGSACALTHQVMADMLQACTARLREAGIGELNYRLGHDEDRQKSNYLLKTASGHVVNKKSRISITEKDCENAE
jgi:hypothetical protein